MTFSAHFTPRRSRSPRPVSDADRCVPGLSFHRAPGALLAVAGLTGGAGASVLAYLIAVTAARESSVPVLAADTGGPTSGLARLADATAPLTLCDIAQRVAADEALPSPFWVQGEHQLRVLAGAPQFTVEASRDALLRVLGDARQVHGLTVADVGTLARSAEQSALAAAGRVLERIAPLSRPELVVARTDPAGAEPPFAGLAALADRRRAPLVLMPSFGRVAEMSSQELAECAQVALEAIGRVLAR